MPNFFDQLPYIRAFIFDVDGVLTDGAIYVTEVGEPIHRFKIRDGYALELAVKSGFEIAMISGRKSRGVELRLRGLGIQHIFLGVESKVPVYETFIRDHALSSEQVVYMGDDMPDLAVMKLVGLPVCPADAIEEIKAISHYISPKEGGQTCVRDIIEKVLKVQNKWK